MGLIEDLQALETTRKERIWEPVMRKYNLDVICEVGVRKGYNFKLMIAHEPFLAVAVDSWVEDGVLGRNDCCYSQDEQDTLYNNFKKEMEGKPFVKICRGYSFEVVKQFPDEYFDFIFIDADHTEEGCSRDLKDWYPKVKHGGVFCGHDYNFRSVRTKNGKIRFGVVEAVDKFVKENNLELFNLQPNSWGVIKP